MDGRWQRARILAGPTAQVVFWTVVNLALGVIFSVLLLLDDRAAQAAGL
jgi:hypothetical protein